MKLNVNITKQRLMENAGITEDVQAQADEALMGIESIFAELKEMPLPEAEKLDLAKNQLGGGLLTLLAKSMGIGGMSAETMRPIMEKALADMKRATSIDTVYQIIVATVGVWVNSEA
jgi:hypothetical protein